MGKGGANARPRTFSSRVSSTIVRCFLLPPNYTGTPSLRH